MAARNYEHSTAYAGRSRIYVDGNTVRREEIEIRQGGKKKVEDYEIRKNRERARHWNLTYVIMLLTATVVTVVICAMYLNLQSNIASHRRTIASLQSQVTELRAANDAKAESLKIYADLNTIYDVATTELGMVYPSDDQVIEFDKSESEYVRQYDQIPTDN